MPIRPSPRPRAGLGAAALVPVLLLLGCGSGPTGPSTAAPSITTTALADGMVEEPYTAGVSATGGQGAFSWSVATGSLPPGLALSVEDLQEGDDVVITGTPETEGTFEFGLRVEDEIGRADTARLEIFISPIPEAVAIETPAVPPAMADAIYQVSLQASGGDGTNYEWSVVGGALPQGLTLGSDGQFDGVPSTPDTATFTVRVTSGGFETERAFTLPVVAENTSRYDITTFPVVEIPASLEDNVREAVRRWEAAITGNLPAFSVPTGSAGFGPEGCGGFGELVNGTSLDDIMILVNIAPIDGPGDILAQAGPCAVRGSNDLPPVGLLTLDEDDLLAMTVEEHITDIIQHEISHVLGFGSLWNQFDFNVLTGAGTADPRYTGQEAVTAYQAAGGEDEAIPVENQGSEGTRDSHWRESTFDAELLTGFSESQATDMYLSEMSIASMSDLGYQVDLSAADDPPLFPVAAASTDEPPAGYDIVGVGPIIVFDDGR